ncbi:unnamed protein product [Brassica rapa subsp. trilocularis]
MAAELFEKAKTGVFWDAEDCKIPSGLNAVLVSKSIRSGLQDTCYHGLTSIFAYGSTEDIMVGFDSSAGKVVYRTTADIISRSECPPAVVMNLTEPGDKHQRYGAFITGVFSWALNNHPPANLILVVGDVAEHEYRFACVFSHLISSGYNVAFVQPENQASQMLFRLGRRRTIWLWEKLSLGEGPIPKQKPPNFHYEAKNSSVNFNLLGVGGLACLLIVTTILGRMASS